MSQSPSSMYEVQRPGRDWVWIMAIAVGLIVLGLGAISALAFSAALYVSLVGWLMIGAGVVQLFGAFLYRGFGGLGLEILFGLLTIALGAVLI